ncbi:hypothetical protein ET475_13625 [Microbacterium protaetiae]|uniref:Uncharacterized protein n=1 Tax=Microbacterium protaetiae TaxID=2509458 RepID=A0A4P6EF91_9MICO|nr:hypothetical protein [Microbacterium protaetiae]QAY60924.1 hypothetical protein ET475_13625 [Microbacterium protaetiae]
MPGGEYVYISTKAPLPEKVIKVIEKRAEKGMRGIASTDSEVLNDAAIAMEKIQHEEGAKTGRHIVVVNHGMSFDEQRLQYMPAWAVSVPGPVGVYPSKAEAVAAAQAWVAGRPEFRTYIVVDALG